MQNVSKTTRQSIDGGGVQDSSEVAGTAKLLRRRRAPVKMIVGCLAMMATALSVYAQEAWQQKVKEELPLMGHRNWIVIVDSAYPLQSGAGVETIDTSQDQLVVLDFVLDAIKNSRHVRPLVHTDAELQYVPEKEAPGIEQYRQQLKNRLTGVPADSILHQKLIDQLNELSKTFHVLILKTTMTVPYTSVFLQLDCKYWSADSEEKLRDKMKGERQSSRYGP
jgi:L-fucose mutarotase/ribose pyranase (RbsD/FucU family)